MKLSRRGTAPTAREEDILSAALELFYTRGFSAASLRDLAAAVGLNIATVYHYFENKDQILFRLQWEALTILNALADEAEDSTRGCCPSERLRALLKAHTRYYLDHQMMARLNNVEYRFLTPQSRAVIVQERIKYRERFVRLVREGMETGELTFAGSPKVAAFVLIGGCSSIENWYRPDGPLSSDQLCELIVQLVMDGIVSRTEAVTTDSAAFSSPRNR